MTCNNAETTFFIHKHFFCQTPITCTKMCVIMTELILLIMISSLYVHVFGTHVIIACTCTCIVYNRNYCIVIHVHIVMHIYNYFPNKMLFLSKLSDHHCVS